MSDGFEPRIDLDFVERVGRCFDDSSLEYLVGAGVSCDAGLPSWGELSNDLLGRFLAKRYGSIQLAPEELERASAVFAERFGREPAADLIRNELGDDFHQVLVTSLYGEQKVAPSALHYDLAAAMGPEGRLHTFNFDCLLEVAGTELSGRPVRTLGKSDGPDAPGVVHLHGSLAPSGDDRGEGVILSERDYHSTHGDWADTVLRQLFCRRDTNVLLVGLSLTDPRLRRLLLDRCRAEERSKVFVLLPESRTAPDAPLIDRLSHSYVRTQERAFWQRWDVEVGYLPSPESLGVHLRAIRLGLDATEWATRGLQCLLERSVIAAQAHLPRHQQFVRTFLLESLVSIKRTFRVGHDLRAGFFVPTTEGRLALAFRSYGTSCAEEARARTLSIAPWNTVQGAAGHAFAFGVTVRAARNSRFLDANFSEAMRQDWGGANPLESLLCVPVSAGPDWVPVGVVYLGSAEARPFWTALEPARFRSLEATLRSSFREALWSRPVA